MILSGRDACCRYEHTSTGTWRLSATQNSKRSNPKVSGKQSAKTLIQPSKPKRSSTTGSGCVEPVAVPTPADASPRLPRPLAFIAHSTLSPAADRQPTALGAVAIGSAASAARASAGPGEPICGKAPPGHVIPADLASESSSEDFAASEPDQDNNSDVEEDGFLVADRDGSEIGGQDTGQHDGQADAGDMTTEEDAFPEMQFELPNPTNVKVKIAEYLQSCVKVLDCPAPRFPEFAVIGRSNVGKSSLINMLTGRKDLALVSKQPGKTKCINHFLINGSWYFVDLPGYGYAKVGAQGRQQFDAFTREYFMMRPNLAMVFLLVDASIPPQKVDLEYANWLTDNEVPFTLVFTKADKRRKGVPSSARDSHVTAFKRSLLEDLAFLPPSILTSSAKGLGRGELLNFIAGLRVAFERSGRFAAIRQGML
ncbi:hypothetical protein Vretimale_3922 [Volvox reticuliferus]|uniref:EngB-type G domain-containing protein n=1 Tax=Volvox reticuliferus TaxID=1737510 RepID=A0A8J4C0K7_9CHLO|nr:hypothetical protein Vretifemale_1525 [Volvox reticuliferus]GIL98568.1 hypothetical protein Vretimale_3922 [Volvox reticuliferus]